MSLNDTMAHGCRRQISRFCQRVEALHISVFTQAAEAVTTLFRYLPVALLHVESVNLLDRHGLPHRQLYWVIRDG